MAWVTRPNGKRYFYLCQRDPDGKIRKTYIGNSLLAEFENSRIETNRLERRRRKQEHQRLLAEDAEADNLFRMAERAVTAALTAAGFQNTRHRGWRISRKMMEKQAAAPSVASAEPQQEMPDMDLFRQAVEAAKKGDTEASRQLLELFSKYPHLAGQDGNMAARALWHWVHSVAGEDKHLHQSLLCELKQQKLLLAREGNGTLVEEKIIDQVMLSWIQLYFYEITELKNPSASLEFARYRADRIERLSKRHLKSLELLSKIRAIRSDIVRVDSLVVNNKTVRQIRKKRRSSGTPVNRISKLVEGMDTLNQN
jgi:hypothetical protein